MYLLSTRVLELLSCEERNIISTAFLGYSVEIYSLAKKISALLYQRL